MRLWLMELAHFAIGIRTGHVEIAEDDMLQPMGGLKVAQDVLDRPFGRPIGIDRILCAVFVQYHVILIAIGRTGRRKDELLAARSDRRLD